MRRDDAAPLAVEGVADTEFGVAAVTVIGEVWVIYSVSQEEGITLFLRPQIFPVHRGWLHCQPSPGLC